MANTSRAETARRNMKNARNAGGVYVDGNTARRLAEAPERTPYYPKSAPARKQAAKKSARPETHMRSLSREARKNREREQSMGKGYVAFIAVVAAAVLSCCINYLQLKSEITGSMKNVAVLESELTKLREDNDAYYSQVTSNIDLNRIRKIAIGRLGMAYPDEDQMMTYTTEGSSYVRQYQDVPNVK